MKVIQEVKVFQPVTIILQTEDELEKMRDAMWAAYRDASEGTAQESFAEELHDTLNRLK